MKIVVLYNVLKLVFYISSWTLATMLKVIATQ